MEAVFPSVKLFAGSVMFQHRRAKRRMAGIAFGVFLSHCTLFAATGNQVFTVTVPAVLTITPPVATVTITHDESDNNQAFAAQQWVAAQNSANGATISFATNQAFTHASNASHKRNAKLDLALFSSDAAASWSVSTASDQTDHAGGDGVATVQAASTAPGDARLNLTVTFLTSDFSTLLQGNYTTTVTATITAN